MSILFFGLAALGLLAMYKALGDTSKVREAVLVASKKAHFHQLLGSVIIVAHASEIGKVISHLSWLHAMIALFLFALWLASRQGSAEELM